MEIHGFRLRANAVLQKFKRQKKQYDSPFLVDMHSHLLPGLDDGVKTFEEAEAIIAQFKHLGFRKLITTPHIMQDTYRNTPEGIMRKLEELQHYLSGKEACLPIEAAAEYYLDEGLMQCLENEQPMLTFGDRYLLFETNFIAEPLYLKDFIFKATTQGYRPVLAHPERYVFLQNNPAKLEDLLNRGVLLQVNILSLTGYYSRSAQQTASWLIEEGWVHFLASDCHHIRQMELLEKALRSKYFQKALTLPLLNNSLQ